jgi:ADP-ribose pyrophosphatase YjhB (NUDIX family)
MHRQFTATVFIIDDSKTLLLFHKKHGKWMPPGGHVEENETPVETARREAFEETGLEIEFIKQENVWFEGFSNAKSIERPYHVLLETLGATAKEPAHQHIDFCYVARPLLQKAATEQHELRWFTLDEVERLTDIFPDVKLTITHLLQPVANRI